MNDWDEARSFADLCELGALFCEGKIEHFNGYGKLVDECDPIREALAIANRSGFLTDDSQTGMPRSRDGSAQRAYVTGRAEEALALRLYTLGLEHDLLTLVVPPDAKRFVRLPVTLDGPHPFTWCGDHCHDEDEEFLGEYLHPQAIRAYKQAWTVEIFDPVWGRNDYLWPRLVELLSTATSWYSPYCSTGTANGFPEFIY